jgi:CDP-glucose 4,6-dehydratase
MVMKKEFWKKKRVFLTGHTGFKGGWLSLWLQQMGAEVTGYSLLPPTQPNLFEIAGIAQGMHSIIGDVRDITSLIYALTEASPDIVIHMAAQPLVRSSYSDPVETYSTNVMGTVNLLEAVRSIKSVRAVVNVTTDKCYENHEWLWGYRENEPMGGFDPYSSSKGCAELITAAYRKSYFNPEKYEEHGLALASARAGNVIGGGDWAEDRLIPDLMRALTQGKLVKIRNPNAIRPWQHVLEPLFGYMLLAEKLFEGGVEYAEGWNFGPNDGDIKSVQWIAESLTKAWGDAGWELDGDAHPHEAHYLKLDCSKAKMRLNWHPRWHLEDALDAIIDWHRAYHNGGNVRKLMLHQIDAYQDNIKIKRGS